MKSHRMYFFSTMILLFGLFSQAVLATEANDELSQAFGAFKKSLGTQYEKSSTPEPDDVLDKALGPVPEFLGKPSSVTADDITPEGSLAALKVLATTQNAADQFDFRLETLGRPLSMVLWAGGGTKQLNALFKNLVSQMYSDQDAKNFLLVLTSSPFPSMTSQNYDFNEVLRDQKIEQAEKRLRDKYYLSVPPNGEREEVIEQAKLSVPERPGVKITISAGMFATFKNVDEFAGQLALALARLNPGVFGIKADSLFLRNQKNLKLIDEAIKGSDKETQDEIRKKQLEIEAELSAMERLLQAKLNPWAIAEYEDRVFGWLSDEYIKFAKYKMVRSLVTIDNANLIDWARPIRFQIQEEYMKHLQSSKRGSGMRLEWTSFSLQMKWLRLRMAAFTKPFFTGANTYAYLGGVTVIGYFSPEIVHWALAALHLTSDPAMQETIRSSWTFSGAFKSIKDVGAMLLDYGYLGQRISSAGVAIHDHFSRFYSYYLTGFGVGVTVLVGKLIERDASGIQNFLISMKKSFISHQSIRKQVPMRPDGLQIYDVGSGDRNQSSSLILINDAATSSNQKPEEIVEVVAGSSNKYLDRGGRIGKKLAEILNSMSSAHVIFGRSDLSAYERAKHVFEMKSVSTGNQMRSFAKGTIKYSVSAINGTKIFATRGWESSVQLGKTTISGSVAAGIAVGSTFASVGRGVGRAGQRTQIYLKRKGSDYWDSVSVLSSRTAEGSMIKIRDVLDAAPIIIKQSSQLAIRFGAFGTKKAFSGLMWLFLDAPGASLHRAQNLAVSMSQYLKEKYDRHQQARLIRQEKAQAELKVLQDGLARRSSFFQSQDLKLEDIQQVIEELSILLLKDELREDIRSEYWGIKAEERRGKNSVEKYLLPAVQKWLDQERLTPATETDFFKLFYIMDLVVRQTRNDLWPKRSFGQISSNIYDRVKERNLPGVNAMVEASAASAQTTFLHILATNGKVKDGKLAANGALLVQACVQCANDVRSSIVDNAILGNELQVFTYLSSPEVTIEQYTAFLTAVFYSYKWKPLNKLRDARRMKSALEKLTPIQKAKIYSFNGILSKSEFKYESISSIFSSSLDEFLAQGAVQLVDQWIQKSQSISQLKEIVESATKQNNIGANEFQLELQRAIEKNVHLLKSWKDLEILFGTDFFWSEARTRSQSSALEAPLSMLLEKNRERYANNPALKYDPIVAEKMHLLVKSHLEKLQLFPQDFEGRLKVFKLFTQRGVSTISDDILGSLLKMGNSEQINSLEDYAARQGRVFDQNLKDQFSIRQVQGSEPYQLLVQGRVTNSAERMQALQEVVRLSQELMTDMGLNYSDFLERLSVQINSTYDEAEFLNNAKGERLAQRVKSALVEDKGRNDNRIKVFTAILPEIKKWKPQHQFDFLLYLRGSIAATPFIEEQFPTFGPERVRKMFQSLPLGGSMVVVNTYLRETLLARKSVTEGYGRKLIDHLVKSGTDSASQKYASLLLEGLLVGIEQAGNRRFQTHVLSALVSMKAGENRSVGETMKLILEQFPGVGPKIGQFLVGTGLLPDEINRVLIGTQDQTLPPSRFEVYSDIEMIAGKEAARSAKIGEILGSGSIKYTAKAVDPATSFELAIQIFRGDVQNNADFQIAILNGMIRHLIKRDGKQWAFLQVIVDGAMNAVQREKEFSREAEKTARARHLYSVFNDGEFSVSVPEQELVNDRLLQSRYARGGNFLKMVEAKVIDKEDTRKIGLKILEMEAQILYGSDKGEIFYDTDRHAGNYLIQVEYRDGRKHYKISPIDFGQMTSIRVDQRDRIAKLFALAGALGTFGANESFSRKVAETIGLDRSLVSKLSKVLGEFFPVTGPKNRVMVTHYFSLISAINETLYGQPSSVMSAETKGGKLDMVYTDFVRAIMQLNQYEKELEGRGIQIPKDAKTPRKILESRAKDHFADLAKEFKLNNTQRFLIAAKNTESWFRAVVRGQKFEALNIRPSREQLENMQMLGGVSRVDQKIVENSRAIRACVAVFR